MKRSIAAFLALALALALPALAAGEAPYDDVGEDAPCYEAVQELYSAEIMQGSGGKFNPDKTITRQEFAAVVCRLLGEEESAKAITTCTFDDVADGHWAAGYITKAVELGIVSGYGGNRFGPTDPVTIQQAAKMLVCAWGYEEEAQAAGGWPDGYMSVAREHLYLLDGIDTGDTAPAKRSDVAMMAYQTLMSPSADEQGGYEE